MQYVNFVNHRPIGQIKYSLEFNKLICYVRVLNLQL